jgi:hypothetical protein
VIDAAHNWIGRVASSSRLGSYRLGRYQSDAQEFFDAAAQFENQFDEAQGEAARQR